MGLAEETRKLIFDPVLIPDLEHTGVRPSMDLEDRLLFYPSGCKNCNLQRNIQNRLRYVRVLVLTPQPATHTSLKKPFMSVASSLLCLIQSLCVLSSNPRRHASSTDQEHTDGGLRAVQDDGVTGGRGMAALGRAGLRSGVRLKLQKQPPNRVSLTPYEKGLGESSVVVSQHAESVDKGSKLLYLVRSPPRQEGRYDLNGVKTLRKKPTSDQEAKQLVRSLQTTSHQMSLLVFDEV